MRYISSPSFTLGRPTVWLAAAALAVLGTACTHSSNAPGTASDTAASGAKLFAANCSRCHGKNGKGGMPIMGKTPQNLTDPAFQAHRTDTQLAGVIEHGKGFAMPAFGSVLKGPQVQALVKYIRSIKAAAPATAGAAKAAAAAKKPD